MAEYDFLKHDKNRKNIPDQEKETPQKSSLNSEQASVLDLQRMIGNQNVQRILSPGKSDANQSTTFIQTKLTVGPVNDQYEQEADRVANQVVNAPEGAQRQEEEELQMKPTLLQRQEEEEELQMKPTLLQRQGDGGFEVGGDIEENIQTQKGGGQSLPDDSRGFFEDRFGYDFGGVNVHTDAQSDTLNRSLSARAFTTGQDIFFRQGEYNPGSKGGQELIAHELTHVVQQGGANRKEDNENKD